MDLKKIFVATGPGDFEYRGFLCWYYDMPHYKGYEVFENEESDEWIGRFGTRAEVRKAINQILSTGLKHIKPNQYFRSEYKLRFRDIRVISFVEGYVVFNHKDDHPSVYTENDFRQLIKDCKYHEFIN
jgi:hypothetical protein